VQKQNYKNHRKSKQTSPPPHKPENDVSFRFTQEPFTELDTNIDEHSLSVHTRSQNDDFRLHSHDGLVWYVGFDVFELAFTLLLFWAGVAPHAGEVGL